VKLIKDIRDWMGLRGRIVSPWRFVRTRRRALPRATCEVRFRDGAVLTLRTATADRKLFISIFARDEYGLSSLESQGADTIIDIGAHVGIFAARVAPFAKRVLSYEPVSATFQLLVENLRNVRNVTATQKAVTDRRGTADIHVFEEPSSNSIFPPQPHGAARTVAVDTVSLADVVEEHSVERCDLLKLDCEGSEYPLIFGAPRALWQRIDRVAMEYHAVAGAPVSWSGEGLAAYLEEVGHAVELRPKGHHPGKGVLFSTLARSSS
jgi:FkbM family methyltransferase